MEIKNFGVISNKEIIKEIIKEITIGDQNGFHVKVITLGATITGIHTEDIDGSFDNIVLRYDDLNGYLEDNAYIGATIGRTAGRTKNGEFYLDNKLIKLDSLHGLHGGGNGISFKVWEIDSIEKNKIILKLEDKFIEGKTPGNISFIAEFEIIDKKNLEVTYKAISDKKTYINMTNHSYFNLTGKKESISEHNLQLKSLYFAPVDNDTLPFDKLKSVENTVFDFRHRKKIKEVIESDSEQIKIARGLDHPFLLEENKDGVIVSEFNTGRTMTISTNQNYVIIYSGNYLDGKFLENQGICFETQDIPNKPTIFLNKNEEYIHKTKYLFNLIK